MPSPLERVTCEADPFVERGVQRTRLAVGPEHALTPSEDGLGRALGVQP